MDSYFKKTRRPTSLTLKRPPQSITPPKAAKIPNTPTTPKDARLARPLHPPPVKRKDAPPAKLQQERRRPTSVKQLFQSVHPQLNEDKIQTTKTATTTTPRATTKKTTTPPLLASPLKLHPIASPIKSHPEASPIKSHPVASPIKSQSIASPIKFHPLASIAATPDSPSKIASGPLKGVCTSLLDKIRAKEAAARSHNPEREHQLRLLGIAPNIVRIIPTVFTASKREVMHFDKVVDKCFKGLKSDYTPETIIDCLHFMDKIAPEWISTVVISKGKFMRINRDKYTVSSLLDAINRFKAKV